MDGIILNTMLKDFLLKFVNKSLEAHIEILRFVNEAFEDIDFKTLISTLTTTTTEGVKDKSTIKYYEMLFHKIPQELNEWKQKILLSYIRGGEKKSL